MQKNVKGSDIMRNLVELIEGEMLDFQEIESPFFLLGLISAFENRYQAKADNFFEEISWKQFFCDDMHQSL